MSKKPSKSDGDGKPVSNDNAKLAREAAEDAARDLAEETFDEEASEDAQETDDDLEGADGETEEDDGGDDTEETEPSPEEQIATLKDQLLRVMAENENVRRRAQRDVEDTSKYAVSNFARDILTIGDNLARALESVPSEAREGNESLGGLLDGVTMTQREFLTTIERHGIKRIDPMGEKFDHNFHQAVFEVEDGKNAPGTVVQVVQQGYTIGGRLLRPAMVGVAKPPAQPGSDGESGTKVDTKV